MSMSGADKRVVIVGGGTAGWMAAAYLANRWRATGIQISLVESTRIGIIGVGEGSTPQLKGFFDGLGIDETEWMPACNATYKIGIRFDQWSEHTASYFHPFQSTLDKHVAQAFVYNNYLYRQGYDVKTHPNDYFVQAQLADDGLAPHPKHHFPFPVQYGYHFDAHMLGQFLKDKALGFGCKHIEATIADVKCHGNGDISALVCEQGQEISGDMFIDCSGFDGLLIQKTLGVGFKAFKENLFNNAAVVFPTERQTTIKAQTVSTAMGYGWRWQIPLTNRTGNGYVYSDQYCSADQAETELRQALGLLASDTQARHLKMKVGQVEKHWHRNCLALGLSQGFIEPLEATALHLVQTTVEMFCRLYEKANYTNQYKDELNQRISARFEGVRDYIVCHYKVNGRTDTQYWLDNADNSHQSSSLTRLLDAWQRGADLAEEIQRQQIGHYYNPISWHCLLAGYNTFAFPRNGRPLTISEERFNTGAIEDFVRRCGLNYPSHEEKLSELSSGIKGH